MRVAVLGDVGDQKVAEVVVRLIAGVCGAEEARASGAGGAEPPPSGRYGSEEMLYLSAPYTCAPSPP